MLHSIIKWGSTRIQFYLSPIIVLRGVRILVTGNIILKVQLRKLKIKNPTIQYVESKVYQSAKRKSGTSTEALNRYVTSELETPLKFKGLVFGKKEKDLGDDKDKDKDEHNDIVFYFLFFIFFHLLQLLYTFSRFRIIRMLT